MKKSDVVTFYNNYASRQKAVGINERHQSIISKLLKQGLKAEDKVLEIGCGIGTLTHLLLKNLTKGHLTALDIAPDNIGEAKKHLGDKINISLICADAVNYDFGKEMFDVIVLPDVIEHIPLEHHSALFQKLSQVLEPKGFIFIHIPNPAYLEWCHKNSPELLQIIDQPIFTHGLIENTLPHNLVISKLETYSIWVTDGDYQYIVLRKRGSEDFSKQKEQKITLFDKVKYKLKHFGK
jgi:2-polyprenyl-3-methyl-5-hydroxy-6-metoxy-1,4-benzoquinol methylase